MTDCTHCGLPLPAGRLGGPGPWFCCFGCRFAHELARPADGLSADGEESSGAPAPTTHLLRLGLGIFLALNIMAVSWLSYSREVFGDGAFARGGDALLTGLFSYLAFFLCTLVVVMLGLPLLADTLTTSRISAQTLIVVAVAAAYALSALHTFRGEGSLYYDTAAMVLVIVTLGNYLEANARRRAADSAHRLLAVLPPLARVRRDGEVRELAPAEVRAGDLVQVRPGDVVPVDGVVAEGAAHVDEASLTGESQPRRVAFGNRVLAGTTSLDGQLWLRAEQVGDDTVLALMERSLADARSQRPPIQRLADRISAVFVPAVVLLAAGLFALHAWNGRIATGLLVSLSVLLISCPCALGLAAPLACWNGLRCAARRGILVDSAATFERAASIEKVFFDKTGTLTHPEPACEKVAVAPGFDESRALSLAAGLESASAHPIARALLKLARRRDVEPSIPRAARQISGLGVDGEIDGERWRLGSKHWAEEAGWGDAALVREAPPDTGCVFLMSEERAVARFDLHEELRPETPAAVAELRRLRVEVGVLSGDRDAPTARLASSLAIPARGGLLPEDKLHILSEARAGGRRVAMVGDGVNDGPVLAAADVGIAVGSASDLARSSGNVRLLSDRLDRVPELLAIARDVRRRILWNLTWSFGFNTVGIVLAAAGLLTPIFAAIAMVLSSLTVVRISSGAGLSPSGGVRAPGGGARHLPTSARNLSGTTPLSETLEAAR